jgi:hypothetical protein
MRGGDLADEGLEASAHGDWLGAGYYTYLASESEQDGNELYGHALGAGC